MIAGSFGRIEAVAYLWCDGRCLGPWRVGGWLFRLPAAGSLCRPGL